MEYNSLIHSVSTTWKQFIRDNSHNKKYVDRPVLYKIKDKCMDLRDIKCKLIYQHIVSNIYRQPTALIKWNSIYDISESDYLQFNVICLCLHSEWYSWIGFSYELDCNMEEYHWLLGILTQKYQAIDKLKELFILQLNELENIFSPLYNAENNKY